MRRTVVILALLGACHGGLHRKDEKMWTVAVQHSEPILGHLLWWDAKSDVPNSGVAVANRWFFQDRWSFGAGLSPTYFDDQGHNLWGLELELGFRWHFAEWKKLGFFLDSNGGFLVTQDPVPARATDWNFTFALGTGAEWRIGEKWSILAGVQMHHFSNGKGLNVAANPAQNEARYWIGFGRSW